ncbi:MAG: NAD kinase [Candidatus Anoxychlamydiales bacterium]|nr:NAD kinase [Candidatus Anoxychlamydiales bacterium]
MIIALFANETKPNSFKLAKDISSFLKKHKIQVVTKDNIAKKIDALPLSKIKKKKIDFLITMGGDGTILEHTHKYLNLEAAVIGINLGYLGFMADIPENDIYPSLKELIDGQYKIDERIILEGKISNKKSFFSINEVVFHRATNPSLIDLKVNINKNYLNTFAADGLIVSTPNGSTAYSLAAGGPILSPDLNGLVLTPISPHTISNRPFVFSSNDIIEIKYISNKKNNIEVYSDGILYHKMKSNESLTLKKSKKTFKLVKLKRHNYYLTLRTKLNWSGKLMLTN